MSSVAKRRPLGRGLSALLSPPGEPALRSQPNAGDRTYFLAPIEQLYPRPDQPRRRFDEGELEELARSIRSHGVIQPLIVRPRPPSDGGGYFLIAGERRWRAAQRAGLGRIPVVIQDVDSREAFERALVENLQRADLNPIEEAEAFQRLVTEYAYTQEQVADRVGKERSTVANSLRLLKLPASVRHLVEESHLSMGHARCLLAVGEAADMEALARHIVARKLSVRAAEELVRRRSAAPANARQTGKAGGKSPTVRDLEERLTKALESPVRLVDEARGRGRIEIRYLDLDHLDRLLAKLLAPRSRG